MIKIGLIILGLIGCYVIGYALGATVCYFDERGKINARDRKRSCTTQTKKR